MATDSPYQRRFNDQLAELGVTVNDTRWIAATWSYAVTCRNGHTGKAIPSQVAAKGWNCRTCKDNERLDRMRTALDLHGGALIEPTWHGYTAPHRALCPHGAPITITPASLYSSKNICKH